MIRSALGIFMAFAATAANAQDVVTATINACLEAEPADQSLNETLETLGWVQVPNSALSKDNFRAIAAIWLADCMAFGSVPAVRWRSEWERSVDTSAGQVHVVAIPNAPTQTFWFDRTDSENVMRIIYFENTPVRVTRCALSSTAAVSGSSLQQQKDFAVRPNMPPIIGLPGRRFGDDVTSHRVQIHLYQTEMIAELINDSFEFNGRVSVYTTSRR